jgi:hypothetical protein
MLLKKQILVGLKRADSVTSPENQLGEIQSLSGYEFRPRQRVKKMLKMKVDPDISMKTKDW